MGKEASVFNATAVEVLPSWPANQPPHRAKLQPWPQQGDMSQLSRTGQLSAADAADPPVCAAGTLKFLVNRVCPQSGHAGRCSPRTSNSNCFPQFSHTYS